MTAAQLAADELYLFQDFPTETLTISAGVGNGYKSYGVYVTDFRRSNQVVLGGFVNDFDLEVMIERSTVTQTIISGQRAVFRNRIYQVHEIKDDDAQSCVIVRFRFGGEKQPDDPQTSGGDWVLDSDGLPIEVETDTTPGDALLEEGGGVLLGEGGDPLQNG